MLQSPTFNRSAKTKHKLFKRIWSSVLTCYCKWLKAVLLLRNIGRKFDSLFNLQNLGYSLLRYFD